MLEFSCKALSIIRCMYVTSPNIINELVRASIQWPVANIHLLQALLVQFDDQWPRTENGCALDAIFTTFETSENEKQTKSQEMYSFYCSLRENYNSFMLNSHISKASQSQWEDWMMDAGNIRDDNPLRVLALHSHCTHNIAVNHLKAKVSSSEQWKTWSEQLPAHYQLSIINETNPTHQPAAPLSKEECNTLKRIIDKTTQSSLETMMERHMFVFQRFLSSVLLDSSNCQSNQNNGILDFLMEDRDQSEEKYEFISALSKFARTETGAAQFIKHDYESDSIHSIKTIETLKTDFKSYRDVYHGDSRFQLLATHFASLWVWLHSNGEQSSKILIEVIFGSKQLQESMLEEIIENIQLIVNQQNSALSYALSGLFWMFRYLNREKTCSANTRAITAIMRSLEFCCHFLGIERTRDTLCILIDTIDCIMFLIATSISRLQDVAILKEFVVGVVRAIAKFESTTGRLSKYLSRKHRDILDILSENCITLSALLLQSLPGEDEAKMISIRDSCEIQYPLVSSR
ncbi:MAG: hypothetical protein NXI00_23045, partial [Cytophagales bacterium]|nr:hypothetical protein [Cytophagales bacterium]